MVVNDIANALLMDHASGCLPEPMAVLMSTHVAINREARDKYEAFSDLGGALLADMDPEQLSVDALEKTLHALDLPADDAVVTEKNGTAVHQDNGFDTETIEKVPSVLRAYLPASLDKLKWRRLGGGVMEYALPMKVKGYKASLLSIAPGKSIPSHTHKGREYTVVLDGAYDDNGLQVQAGDFVCNDSEDTHRPLADPDHGCLCFAVINAPLKFNGPFGWMVNPFLKV